jgi:hypothetical protein
MGDDKANIFSFYSGMLPFHDFIQEKEDENIILGICIEEEDYTELSLHSDILRLGEIMVEIVVLPLLINYLYDFIKIEFKKEIKVRFNIKKIVDIQKLILKDLPMILNI